MIFDVTLKEYLKEIDDTKLLSKEEELELANLVIENQDPIARDHMIRSNLRLVVKIAKQFTGRNLSYSDLVEEGNLGLMRAVDTFDPDFGVRFSTYAAWWIKQSIKRSLLLNAQPVHIPTYLVEMINQYKQCFAQLESALGYSPSSSQIAEAMKITIPKAKIVGEIVSALNSGHGNGSFETDNDVFDSVCDNKTAQPFLNMLTDEELNKALDLLKKLEPREAQILTMKFGLDGQPCADINEIAENLNLTRERIRQLQKSALEKLKNQMCSE